MRKPTENPEIFKRRRKKVMASMNGAALIVAAHPEQQPVQSTISKARFNFITFHQKYSYEDFIEGIKPLLQEVEVFQ